MLEAERERLARYYHYRLPGARVVGGEHPESRPGAAETLAALAVTHVLTLTPEPLAPDAGPVGRSHVPIEEVPTVEDLERAVGVVSRRERLGDEVLVHCRQGLDRTGTVLAACLVDLGWRSKDALAWLHSVWPERRRHPSFLELCEPYADALRAFEERTRRIRSRNSVPPAMLLLAIGAAHVRCGVTPAPRWGTTLQASLWRRRHSGLPLDVGSEPSCHASFGFEPHARPLDAWPAGEERDALEAILKGARDALGDRADRRTRRVAVTVSAALAERFAPHVEAAAKAAGFREVEVHQEEACVLEAVGRPGPVLVADVGRDESRFYARKAGGVGAVACVRVPFGASHLVEAVREAWQTRGLIIDDRAAVRLCEDGPDAPLWPRTVKGRSLTENRPASVAVDREEVWLALRPLLDEFAGALRAAARKFSDEPSDRLPVVLCGAPAAAVGLIDAVRSAGLGGAEVAAAPESVAYAGLARLVLRS